METEVIIMARFEESLVDFFYHDRRTDDSLSTTKLYDYCLDNPKLLDKLKIKLTTIFNIIADIE